MSNDGPFNVAAPKLGQAGLAMIGLATHYEAHAKTTLSLVLKALQGLTHKEWVQAERRQFADIVDLVSSVISSDHKLRPYFTPIFEQHRKLRESRNFVVHAVWGEGADGRPTAHCYRRGRSGDEADIMKASNDCLQLANLCHQLAYQTALCIAAGEVPEGPDPSRVSMRVVDRWVKF